MSKAVTVPKETNFTPEQMKLIRDVVAPTATPDELKLFLYRCQALGLDPLKPGMIHFVKYGTGPGTIVVGIEGFRAKAQRTGKLDGIERGVIRDDKGQCVGAYSRVHRLDWKHPAYVEVSLQEYTTGRGPWQRMPESMIQKVAEAAALRMAFPDDLGGVYESAEMDQAEAGKSRIFPDQPPPDGGDGNTTEIDYKIDFGKWSQRSLEQVYRDSGPKEIAAYIDYLEKAALKKDKPIAPDSKAGVFIREAEAFLGAMENMTGSEDEANE